MTSTENPWKLTRKGFAVDLMDPKPETISPGDIAGSLALQCRWGGHTKSFFSVAQHCVHVAEVVVLLAQTEGYPDELVSKLRIAAVLHDAHEAYTGDISTPVKRVLGPAVADLERRLDSAIAERFGIDPDMMRHEIVKEADRILLVTEYRDLMPQHANIAWLPSDRCLMRRLERWDYERARMEFGHALGNFPQLIGSDQ